MAQEVKAVFIGDSITEAGARSGPRGDLGTGYVRRIREMADQRAAPLRIINSGVSGDRIRDVRRRWERDCLAHHPDIVTVLIGVNDTWRRYDAGETTSIEQYTEDYQAILDAAAAADVPHLVIMEPFLAPISAEQARWRTQDLEAKIETSRAMAAEYGAVLVPLDARISATAKVEGPLRVVDDGVHPTARGHQIIADLWWAAVDRLPLYRT